MPTNRRNTRRTNRRSNRRTNRTSNRRTNRRSTRRNARRTNRRSNRRNIRRTNRRSNRRNTRRTNRSSNRRNLYGGGETEQPTNALRKMELKKHISLKNKNKLLKEKNKSLKALLHKSKGLIDLQSIEIEEQKAKINIIQRELAKESIKANDCCEKCSVVQEPSKIKTLPHTNLAQLHTANIPKWTDIAPNASPTDNKSKQLLKLTRRDLQGNIDETVVPFVTGADLSVMGELGESSSDNP